MRFTVLTLAAVAFLATISAQTLSFEPVPGGLSGVGFADRMWDCCKPSCSWKSENLDVPVQACEADGTTRADANAPTGCEDGGTSFICSDQHSWVVNSTFAYGYVGASFVDGGGLDNHKCCACFVLSYTGAQGKKLLVQVINTGGDYSQNQFNIVVPGGGVGYYTQGCTRQWGAPVGGWGEQYGGLADESQCSELPEQLQEACHFRWQFLDDVSNKNIQFQQVVCPAELTQYTGCVNNS